MNICGFCWLFLPYGRLAVRTGSEWQERPAGHASAAPQHAAVMRARTACHNAKKHPLGRLA